MTFREFLSVLGARWRIVALSLLAVIGAAAVQTMMTPAVYTSSARIYLSATQPAGTTPGSKATTYAITASDLKNYLDVLTSPSVIDPLREKLNAPPGYPLNVAGELSSSSSFLTITATGGDPELVARTANEAGPVLANVAKKFSPLLAANGQSVESTSIAPATVPGAPTSPNGKLNIALGGLLGLALGIGLALLTHTIDTKVRTEDDIQALSPRPILGDIPIVKAGAKEGMISIETDPHGRHAEAIRRLRTNLLFVDVTTGGHSFVITSSVPGEGKTTTTINLAIAMADAGSRVLLIDGDLRNPSVARAMGLDGSFGLTTLLLGHAEPDDVIQRWRTSSLFVLPAGAIPPNPSELLGSEPMEILFGKLAHDFDFILVDSPPVVPVIDAVLINKLTHGLVMVVAADRTKKRDLQSAIHSLETVGAPIAGFAINMAPTSSTAHRYGYYGHTAEAATKLTRREQRRQHA